MEVKKRDFKKLQDGKRSIRSASALLHYYIDNVDALNRAHVCKDKIAEDLNVSRRTVTSWIRLLVDEEIIKFKYSGSVRLNPEIWFEGSEEEFEKASAEFLSFRGDI